MADDMKFAPSELVGERDRVRRHFADGVFSGNVTGDAVSADIDESVGVPDGVEAVEDRRKHSMTPEPAVNDDDLSRAVADRLMPNHFFLLTSPIWVDYFLSAVAKTSRQAATPLMAAAT